MVHTPPHLKSFSKMPSSSLLNHTSTQLAYRSSSTVAAAAAAAVVLDRDTVLTTLSSYSNDWKRALDFFHWSSSSSGAGAGAGDVSDAGGLRSDPLILARIVDILGKHFEFPLAWSILDSSQRSLLSSPPDLRRAPFRSLFNRLAAARLVTDAFTAYQRATAEFGFRDDRATFHLLVDALCDHYCVSDAEGLCLRSEPLPPPFHPDVKTYNLLLRGWVKVRSWGRCREFWEEMDRKEVPKDLHSYTIYMDAQSKSGKPFHAVKLYKEMKKKGLRLDVVAYNTAIQAIGLSQGVDFSVRLYREMLDARCKPNEATFNTIVKLFCREGRFREGYAFVDQMRKNGFQPNVITYHCFFQHLNRPQEILSLFDRMVNSGCRPRMDTYVMLMKKFGRWGFLRPVFIIWKAIEEHGYSPDAFAYNALIDALLQKKMVDMARNYNEEMVTKGLSPKLRKELRDQEILTETDGDNALSVSEQKIALKSVHISRSKSGSSENRLASHEKATNFSRLQEPIQQNMVVLKQELLETCTQGIFKRIGSTRRRASILRITVRTKTMHLRYVFLPPTVRRCCRR